jgi:hypothetical protein
MNTRQKFFRKYELPLFLLVTYALSWWSAPLMNGQLIPYGPTLAAILVLGLSVGGKGLSELWGRVTKWHISFTWFIAGPAIIGSYHATAFVANLLLGAKLTNPPYLSLNVFFELLLIGGLWEEPGWSGYLLPKMQERFANHPNGMLLAAVVTGVFRSIWHLPLFLYGHILWFDIFVFNFAFQLIIAWVFYRSGGSVLAAMLLHFVSNLMGSYTYPMFEAGSHTTYTALFMVAACLAAFLLIFSDGFSQRMRSPKVPV